MMAVDPAGLRAVEEACAVALGGTDLSRREEAEIYLFNLFPTYDNVPPSIAARGGERGAIQRNPEQTLENALRLLEQAQTAWAKYFAATVLLSVVNSHFGSLDIGLKSGLRGCVGRKRPGLGMTMCLPGAAAFQALRGNAASNLVTGALARLLSSLTCLGWLEDDLYKATVTDSVALLNSDVPDGPVIMDLLSAIVLDMSDSSQRRNKSASRHRRTAVSFRDTALHNLFLTSLACMKRLTQSSAFGDAQPAIKRARGSAAGLCVRCLSFDFLGTNPDEAEEAAGATQIPTSWRSDVPDALKSLFELYRKWSPPETQPLMEAIGLLSACRKSLFSEEERKTFLQHLLRGLTDTCQSSHGLSDEGTFHELTRLMARLVLPLSEVDQLGGFQLWLDHMVQLTLRAFGVEVSATAVTNILQFWARVVNSFSNVGTKNTEKMRQVTTALVSRFIGQRLDGGGDRFDEDDAGHDEAQLEFFAGIARFTYKVSVEALVAAVEREAVSSRHAVRTAWLLLMASHFISSRQPYGVYSEDDDTCDGMLSLTVFQVMQTPKASSAAVSLAFLKFLDALRKTYSTESGQRYSKLYESLGSSFGITEPAQLIAVTCEHAFTTLAVWKDDPVIVRHAVKLLHEMSLGYTSAKNMKKLGVVQQLLFGDGMAGGLHPQIPFLSSPATEKSVRVQLYGLLARLLVANPANDGDISEEEFGAFVRPWTDSLQQLSRAPHAFTGDAVLAIQNLFRHIQGFLAPISSKKAYGLALGWLLPHLTSAIIPFLRSHVGDPGVAASLLKLLCEVAQNRVSRISVETSPNGVLLFRAISDTLAIYAGYATSLPEYGLDNAYARKIKGTQSCFRLFSLALAGRYVNFSLFKLYDDPALRTAIDAVFRLMKIPISDILNYQKLQTACCQVLDAMTDPSFLHLVDSIPDTIPTHLFHIVSEVLKNPDSANAATCASIVDHIATFVYAERTKSRGSDHFLLRFLESHGDILPFTLLQLLQAVLLEDSSIQWSLSRPLLPLVLLNPAAYSEISSTLVGMQLPHRQSVLQGSLDALLEGVPQNTLSQKARDTVSSSLTAQRRTLANERFVEADLSRISPFRRSG
ncbi:hypothetical protein DFJ74DRAFT_15129 [Hyaloraphidium curvatum]|nr:hypothetical protein DFJ74DRAFT_15129 [Hyaloraphidium curvatum]